jgi:hypothetical protein
MPESRWAPRKIGAFGRAEFSALALLIRVRWRDAVEQWANADAPDEPGQALAVELLQRWEGIDVPLSRRCPRSSYLSGVHDTDLIAAALDPGATPCVSGPARVRLLEHMREADMRDVILGGAQALADVISGKAPPEETRHWGAAMLTMRGIETRLRKLEAKRRPPGGVFFLAWGHDEAEIERAVANAKAQAEISRGDTLVRALWTGHNGTPASRWIAQPRRELSPAEDGALMAALERRCAEAAEEMAEVVNARGNGVPRTGRVSEMTDAQLLAAALGEPVR